MGLVDVLNGMSSAQSGQHPQGTSSGMSPMQKAMIGALAYHAVKSFTGSQASAASSSDKQSPGATGGGLADLLKGSGLGGLLASGGAGSMVSGGLKDLLNQFQQNGQGDVAKSWIGAGPNKTISPKDLEAAFGTDRINTLAKFSGMSREDLLKTLSQQLPGVVDQLTPEGRLPSEQEAARFV